MRELWINKRLIADHAPAYVIAEIGANGSHDMEKNFAIIRAAKDSGASAVKCQTRTPKDLYAMRDVRGGYLWKSGNPHWMAETYGAHREALEFSPEQWRDIFEYCHDIQITAFSTPFDFKSADLLESLKVPAFKIASGDATNIPLITYVSKFKKPVIVSTGGCNTADVDRVSEALKYKQHAILQCSCVYPAPDEVMNLNVVTTFRERFPETVIGLSTHNKSWIPSLAAYALGARIFEHHFTVDKTWKGTDNNFSLNPDEMSAFVSALEQVRVALGSREKKCEEVEFAPTMERRKQIVAARKINKGEVFTKDMLAYKCPLDGGLPPYYSKSILGMKAAEDIEPETVLKGSHVG